MVRLTVGTLRSIIAECVAGSHPDETYGPQAETEDRLMLDKDSTYVPMDIKRRIRQYFRQMGLTVPRRRRAKR